MFGVLSEKEYSNDDLISPEIKALRCSIRAVLYVSGTMPISLRNRFHSHKIRRSVSSGNQGSHLGSLRKAVIRAARSRIGTLSEERIYKCESVLSSNL